MLAWTAERGDVEPRGEMAAAPMPVARAPPARRRLLAHAETGLLALDAGMRVVLVATTRRRPCSVSTLPYRRDDRHVIGAGASAASDAAGLHDWFRDPPEPSSRSCAAMTAKRSLPLCGRTGRALPGFAVLTHRAPRRRPGGSAHRPAGPDLVFERLAASGRAGRDAAV